jgi:septum formation protein
MSFPTIILASKSPRRVGLVRQLDLEFQVVPSDTEEIHNEQLTAWEIAQINACRKARAVAKKLPDALVLGADTLVYLKGTLFGKPRDIADAHRMLQELQGQTHQVVTGVCLIHLRAHRQRVFAEMTDVTFRQLSPEEIQRYLVSIDPLDKAGAYAIQDNGGAIVRGISGSYSNVVGLPIERLAAELAAWQPR